MSLDKSIRSKKEKRKPYKKSKAFDSSCRNHGSCPYCRDNRTYKVRKKLKASDEKIKEFFEQELIDVFNAANTWEQKDAKTCIEDINKTMLLFKELPPLDPPTVFVTKDFLKKLESKKSSNKHTLPILAYLIPGIKVYELPDAYMPVDAEGNRLEYFFIDSNGRMIKE